MNVREASENGEISLISVKTEHQCADIFTKSLTRTKFERFRDTIRGEVTYEDMVKEEMNTSELLSKKKEAKTTHESSPSEVKFFSVSETIAKVQRFTSTSHPAWPMCTIECNHYSRMSYQGRVNPLQSLQECIEGRAPYAIPGY